MRQTLVSTDIPAEHLYDVPKSAQIIGYASAWVLFLHAWRLTYSGGRLSQTTKSECPGGLWGKTLSDLGRGE